MLRLRRAAACTLLLLACKDPAPAPSAPPIACLDRDGDGPGACCEHDHGLDPAVVTAACGFTAYLGERRDIGACTRVFKRGDAEVALRVEDLDGLTWDAAVALHDRGHGPDDTIATLPIGDGVQAHRTRSKTESWLIVPGWSRPRRLAWPNDACDDDAIRKIAVAMNHADERPPVRPHATATPGGRPLPEPSADGLTGSLIARHAGRAAKPGAALLPGHAKALILDLLAVAARDRLEPLPALIAADARWGRPDRRELDAHPILGDDAGAAFLDHLRRAAARFAADVQLHCPPATAAQQAAIEADALPMWCFFKSADNFDVLAFRLRNHAGVGKVEYVGLFPERPTAETRIDSTLPVPPLFPATPP